MDCRARLSGAMGACLIVVGGVGGMGCSPAITMLSASLTCANGVLDPGESDVDCGGICATKCAEGQRCTVPSDCVSGGCDETLAVCATASCSDGHRNGDETDVDCGGGSCPQCGEGKGCSQPLDCESHICQMAPGCTASPCKMECMASSTETSPDGGVADGGSLGGKACSDASECDDHNPCTEDQCVPSGGNEFFTICYNQPLSGVACDDESACTVNDTCQEGSCTGTAISCPAIDQCHLAGTCDPVGGCPNPAKDDGTPCDDGNACTSGEACQGGVCTGGTAVSCSAADCFVVGAC